MVCVNVSRLRISLHSDPERREEDSNDDPELTSPPSIQPPPLFNPPSRARRRFAERLAERQRAQRNHSSDQDNQDDMDLAEATDEINLDDMDDTEVHQISLSSEPLSLDIDEDDEQFGDHHPEDHTNAWHDPERTASFDEDDDVGIVMGGGLGSGGASPSSPTKRRSGGVEMENKGGGGGRGPGRFGGSFEGESSDSD